MAGPLITALLFAFVCVVGWQARLPEFRRPFWQDEIRHNLFVLDAYSFWELRQFMRVDFQPLLDYLVRMYLWFPLVGVNEASFRLLPFLVSMCCLGLAFSLGYRYLRRRGENKIYSWGGAVIVGMYTALHPTQVYYAVEGRHYALVLFASMIWFYGVLLGRDVCSPGKLCVLSLFLVNTHFFSLPLVASTYALFVLYHIVSAKHQMALAYVVSGLVVASSSLAMNYPALSTLITAPPGGQTRTGLSLLAAGLQGAWSYWGSFEHWMNLPLCPAPLWYVFLLLAVRGTVERRDHYVALAMVAGFALVAPLTLAVLTANSDYQLADRYLAPLWGLGFTTLLFALGVLPILFRSLLPGGIVGPRVVRLAGRGVSLLIFFYAVTVLLGTLKRESLRLPPSGNYTELFGFFHNLHVRGVAREANIVFISEPEWLHVIPRMYWHKLLAERFVDGATCAVIGDELSARYSQARVSVFTPAAKCTVAALFRKSSPQLVLILRRVIADRIGAISRIKQQLVPSGLLVVRDVSIVEYPETVPASQMNEILSSLLASPE